MSRIKGYIVCEKHGRQNVTADVKPNNGVLRNMLTYDYKIYLECPKCNNTKRYFFYEYMK